MKRIFGFSVFEIILYLICIALFVFLAFFYKSNIFELISTLLGLISVSLNSKKITQCFFFYVFYVLIYGIVSFVNKQYGEGILNLCYNLPVYLITIYNLFIRKKSENKEDIIRTLEKKEWIVILIVIPIITVFYGIVLSMIGSRNPYLNSLATAFSVVSVFLASRLVKHQWLFWVLYSLVLIFIWFSNFSQNSQTGVLYLVLNIIYIVLNIKGYINWNQLERKQKEEVNV